MNTIKIEIYFSDLSLEKQQEINEKLGIDGLKDTNWDVFPIGTLEFDAESYFFTGVMINMTNNTENSNDILDIETITGTLGELLDRNTDNIPSDLLIELLKVYKMAIKYL